MGFLSFRSFPYVSCAQDKYIRQYEDLYEDFHLIKTPLLEEEIRGVPALRSFSGHLVAGGAVARASGEGRVSKDDQIAALQAEIRKLREALGKRWAKG